MRDKDTAIDDLVARLQLSERGWTVVDHWEALRCAIGIASVEDPRRLVYVSTSDKTDGCFDCECELPPRNSEEVYAPAGGGQDVTFEELLAVMTSHLGITGPKGSSSP